VTVPPGATLAATLATNVIDCPWSVEPADEVSAIAAVPAPIVNVTGPDWAAE
jgi:hypothetical protein